MYSLILGIACLACDARRAHWSSHQPLEHVSKDWEGVVSADRVGTIGVCRSMFPNAYGNVNDPQAFASLLLALNPAARSHSWAPIVRGQRADVSSLQMGPKLHGSQQSRSPLVNWYAYEAGIDLEMLSPRPSNHPFQQVPYLVDEGGVEVFESGAILLYLADAYGGASTPQDRAKFTKWVVWANSELDGLCFGAIPGDHRVRGTSMDKPNIKAVATLDSILSNADWLVNNEFSVADVAVCSYLNYVPLFHPQANLGATPSIAKYMKRCAERPAFSKAFGSGHANMIKQSVDAWLSSPPGGGLMDGLKKMMG